MNKLTDADIYIRIDGDIVPMLIALGWTELERDGNALSGRPPESSKLPDQMQLVPPIIMHTLLHADWHGNEKFFPSVECVIEMQDWAYRTASYHDGNFHDKEGGIIENIRRWTPVNILTWQRD